MLHFFDAPSLTPSQRLLGLCEILDVRAKREFLAAFIRGVVGVKVQKALKPREALVRVLDANADAFSAALREDAVRLDILRLLRAFCNSEDVGQFRRSADYHIEFRLPEPE
jgi:tRNA 2-selenouridine synthase SelU